MTDPAPPTRFQVSRSSRMDRFSYYDDDDDDDDDDYFARL